ncbi:thymidine phosphorylase, partial [Micrococcus sp. SIMBA_144]
IDAYTRGAVAEEQMSALAMAICINDMAPGEIAHWTQAMIDSGERMDFSSLSRPTSDNSESKVARSSTPVVSVGGASSAANTV